MLVRGGGGGGRIGGQGVGLVWAGTVGSFGCFDIANAIEAQAGACLMLGSGLMLGSDGCCMMRIHFVAFENIVRIESILLQMFLLPGLKCAIKVHIVSGKSRPV